MLKKIRRRVILAAMLAFFAVTSLIVILINVGNYIVVTDNADKTLSYIMEYEKNVAILSAMNEFPAAPFMEIPYKESNYMTRFFIVRLDSQERITSISTDYIASIDEEAAISYSQKVIASQNDSGYIDSYRYAKGTILGKTVIIFLNTYREQQLMLSIFVVSIIVSVISLALVFILVFIFSNRAIRPMINNIERQKQFITDASHELKTPLTSISTSIDVISIEHGDDEWTDNIRNQTDRMAKLVNELVTLSRLDEAVPLPNKALFSISSAAHEIVNVFEPQIKANGKTFIPDIEENLSFYGDKNSIQKLLSVLMDNATRYSDINGQIRLSVHKKHNKTILEVFNTCNLETPPDTHKLFDRFYRPDASRNTATGGTGVGLSIAKAVVDAHHGKITATCPDGRSMTITAII